MQRRFILRASSLFFNTKTYINSIYKFNNTNVRRLTLVKRPTFRPEVSTSKRYIHIKPISTAAIISIITSYYYYNNRDNKLKVKDSQAVPISTSTNLQSQSVTSQLSDDSSRVALQSKSMQELLLALFVYKLCTVPWLVDIAPYIIDISEKMHLQDPIYWFAKKTFFKQFCGGETAEECVITMNHLSQSNINCILDLSIEADLHIEETKAIQNDKRNKHWQQEQQADATLRMLKTCIKTAAQGHQDEYSINKSLVAVKVTALAPLDILLQLNQVIDRLNKAFEMYQLNGRIDSQCVEHVATHICPPTYSEIQRQQRTDFLSQLKNQDRTLDYNEYITLFSLNNPGRKVWWETVYSKSKNDVFLTREDLEIYDRMVQRLDEVCTLAYELEVGIMIDAEQSYFQEAIDYIAMNLQQQYNRLEHNDHIPIVYNTYQMYTKTAQKKIERDVDRADKENFTFAAKLVRGAYMVSERKRSQKMGYESPIHDSIEDTHTSYNNSVRYLINKLHKHQENIDVNLAATNTPIVFMVASHNRDSTILTVEEMERHHISPKSGVVHFGQLFGMQDQISYTLAQNGYSIYKYLPYGTIDEVIPYLLRRAQENATVLGSVNNECELIWQEIKDRLLCMISFYTHLDCPSTSSIEYTSDNNNTTNNANTNDRIITGASTEVT